MNNVTNLATRSVAEVCGAKFCPGSNLNDNPNLQQPEKYKIQMLMGIFMGLMVCSSLLVSVFSDSLKR